jgi:hypothetical protein
VTLKPPTAAGVSLGRKIVELHQVSGAVRLHAEPPLRVIIRHDPVGTGRGSTLLSAGGGHGESYRLQATYRNQKEATDETRMEECADSATRNRRVPLRGTRRFRNGWGVTSPCQRTCHSSSAIRVSSVAFFCSPPKQKTLSRFPEAGSLVDFGWFA